MKNEECLICGAPLEYLEKDTLRGRAHQRWPHLQGRQQNDRHRICPNAFLLFSLRNKGVKRDY